MCLTNLLLKAKFVPECIHRNGLRNVSTYQALYTAVCPLHCLQGNRTLLPRVPSVCCTVLRIFVQNDSSAHLPPSMRLAWFTHARVESP